MRHDLKKIILGLLAGLLFLSPASAEENSLTLLFFGDSLTAGYGIDPDSAYPARIQEKINAAGLKHKVVNAGLSGETTAGGLRRVNWILRRDADVFVLALGGNDGMRGIETTVTKENLKGIIDRVRDHSPETRILLAGMEAPPNMGDAFTTQFREIFPVLAEENNLPLIPFLLEGVGGARDLNLPDGVHPTEDGHEIIARHVWKTLQPLLEEMAKEGL